MNEMRKYLGLVKRWWWLLVVSAVVPMAVSYYFVSQRPDYYQSQATIVVGTSLQNPDPDPWQMNLSNTLAAAYAELVRQGPVTEAVIERLGLQRTPAQLAAQIGTKIYPDAQLLEIQVTDTNPEAAALIANALADELIRRSPASGGGDPVQQEFIRSQLEELQTKIADIGKKVDALTASMSELTSAAEVQAVQDQIAASEEVRSTYHATYAALLDSYRAESPNVLSLFDPAVVPQWPIASKTESLVAVAGAAGLGLALGAIVLMQYLDTSLRWEEEGVQSVLDMPVLGVIPRVSRRQALLSSDPSSPVADGVRAVQANLFLVRPDHPFETLLLTSPDSPTDKSLVLTNLAIVMAAVGKRVIVVDADMHEPTLHKIFDRPNVAGLADVLSNDKGDEDDPLSVPLQETDLDNICLLSAGHPPEDPAALLTSPRFPALLRTLMDRGDVILIDSPPVLGPPDATAVARLAEGTILVVSVGLTRCELIQQARDRLLAQQGVNLLGLAINRAKLKGSRYYSFDQRSAKAMQKIGDGDEVGLTVGEAAAYLGISETMARRWCKTGRLTARRSGLRLRVSREGVECLAQVQMSGETIEGGAKA